MLTFKNEAVVVKSTCNGAALVLIVSQIDAYATAFHLIGWDCLSHKPCSLWQVSYWYVYVYDSNLDHLNAIYIHIY